jgi:hypothetical protein
MRDQIEARCPACGKSGRVPGAYAGKAIRCKGCGSRFVLAAAAEGPALAVPPGSACDQCGKAQHLTIDSGDLWCAWCSDWADVRRRERGADLARSQRGAAAAEANGRAGGAPPTQGRRFEAGQCPACGSSVCVTSDLAGRCPRCKTGIVADEWARLSFSYGCGVTDGDLTKLRAAINLRDLGLSGCDKITDATLLAVAGLPNLTWLDLSSTKVTDAGLAHLAQLTSLKTLHLTNTVVSNEGLPVVARLKNLEYLFLIGTRVDEAGLVHLEGLTKLRELALFPLDLGDAPVHSASVQRLVGALPKLHSIGRTRVR